MLPVPKGKKETLVNEETIDRHNRPALFWTRIANGGWNYDASKPAPSILEEKDAGKVWKSLVEDANRVKAPVVTYPIWTENISIFIGSIGLVSLLDEEGEIMSNSAAYSLLFSCIFIAIVSIYYSTNQRNTFESELLKVKDNHHKKFKEKGFELNFERHKFGWEKVHTIFLTFCCTFLA